MPEIHKSHKIGEYIQNSDSKDLSKFAIIMRNI